MRDFVLGIIEGATVRANLYYEIRAAGGSASKLDLLSLDLLKWRKRRLSLVGNKNPGMGSAAARLATWFSVDVDIAARILNAVGGDEDRALAVFMFADMYDIDLYYGANGVEGWSRTIGARLLRIGWKIAAPCKPEDRLFWAKKIAGVP